MAKISDLQLLQFLLDNPAATDEQIGNRLGMSRVRVNQRRNDPDFKTLLNGHLRKDLEILTLARAKAVRRICEELDNEDDRVALKAAALILSIPMPENHRDEAGRESTVRSLLAKLKIADQHGVGTA